MGSREAGEAGREDIINNQCPMPNAQFPIPCKLICPLAISLTTLRN
ncbi:MAG: hypothetical protein V7K98_27795 [Nostoc sp.]